MPYIQERISSFALLRGAKKIIPIWISALIAVFAFLLLGSAVAADARKPAAKASAKSGTYQDERKACMNNPNVDRAACLRELGAARQAARRGTLTDSDTDFRQNALRRCEAFTQQDERKACERRVLGDGSMSGSVEEGGLLRQTITVETVQPGTSASGSQPSMQPDAPRAMPPGNMPAGATQPDMNRPASR